MFDTIVLATDDAPSGTQAARCAAELARRHGSKIVVLHVSDSAMAPDRIRDQVEELREAGVSTRLAVIGNDGHPAAAVTDFVTALKADVVITGTSRSTAGGDASAVSRIVHRIVETSPCAVLAVPLATEE
jgi:nucleotide-binding universal stress UspA family protein